MRKTILVTGGTGKQGSSVVDFLLKDGTFNVRCLLRNVDSSTAKSLFNKGVQVVKGDLEDVDSMVRASKYMVPEYALPLDNYIRDLDKYYPSSL